MGDPTQISRIALEQITLGGWSGTTMAAIAERSGVSEPTLFRYFPTKADVLWHGMDESARVFRENFARRAPETPVVVAIADAYRDMLLADPVRLSLIKVRAAIITHDDAAAEASWRNFEAWRGIVTDMVREGLPGASPTRTRILGAMVWSALWSALTAWSVTDSPDPSREIADARAVLASLA